LISRRKEESKRKERLGKREDFQRLLSEGKRFHSDQYSLIVLRNDLNYMRSALSIKKSIGNAVSRNYEKRLCREFLRREIIGEKKGYDVLIIIKDRSENYRKSFDALYKIFQRFEIFSKL
jgi:ribonuclease P protein component